MICKFTSIQLNTISEKCHVQIDKAFGFLLFLFQYLVAPDPAFLECVTGIKVAEHLRKTISLNQFEH